MTKDRVTGLIALVIGCLVAAMTLRLPETTMAGDVGPKVFPFISAGILIFCGAGLLITGKKKEEKPFYTKEQLVRLALIFGVVLVYCILIHFIGYLISTLMGSFAISMMFGRKAGIAWWKCLIFAVILTLVLNYSFVNLFSIQLPKGELFY